MIADVSGVGDVKMDGIIMVQTDIGIYLATGVGTPIGNTVSINRTDVTAASGNDAMVVNYYTVTYDTNGGSDAPVDGNTYLEGTKAAVLGQAEMAKAGLFFPGLEDWRDECGCWRKRYRKRQNHFDRPVAAEAKGSPVHPVSRTKAALLPLRAEPAATVEVTVAVV